MKAKSYSGHKILFLSLGISIVFLINDPVFGQSKRANNWYFGFFAGLSFNAGSPPEVLYDSENGYANCGNATISDEDGSLLFYTNGAQIWNKEHNPLQNSNDFGDLTTQVQ